MVDFTDEEGYGKYLDMHECYEKYINLKGVEVILSIRPPLNDSLFLISGLVGFCPIFKEKKTTHFPKSIFFNIL